MIRIKQYTIVGIYLILNIILMNSAISTSGYIFEAGINISTIYYGGIGGDEINYQIENISSSYAWGWNDTCIYFQNYADGNITDYCESSAGTYQVSVTTTTVETTTTTTIISIGGNICQENQDVIDIPCYIVSDDEYVNCNETEISLTGENIYGNGTINFTMYDYYSNRCVFEFTYIDEGIYFYDISSNETGKIIVGASNMQFYNLTAFAILFAIGIIMMLLMHKYTDNYGISITLGSFASGIFIVTGMLILSGLSVIYGGYNFIGVGVNNYIALICALIALYCGFFSVKLYQFNKPKENPFAPL